jgi:hypothetical protein
VNKIKRLMLGAALLGLLVAAGMLGLFGHASASVDSWSGHTERTLCQSASLTLGTPSVIVSAVTTANQNVRAFTVTDSGSGVVQFYNSATMSAAAQIGAFGVLANTPLVISEDQLGLGMKSGVGNPIYVNAATGTVSITFRVRADPQ